jgi:RNA-directed DNA polymerase
MKESYGEGLANHAGPESCGGGSNAMAEALTGGRAGQVLSREILLNFGVPTLWDNAEGNIGYIGIAKYFGPCAGSKTLCMHGNTLHGSREIPCLPLGGG